MFFLEDTVCFSLNRLFEIMLIYVCFLLIKYSFLSVKQKVDSLT